MAGPTLTGAGWLVDEIDRQLVQYDAETQSLVSGDEIILPLSAGSAVAVSRSSLATDNGGTFELANGVTYTLSDAVALPLGVTLIGPTSGSATIAVSGSATINGGASSVTISAGQVYAAIPRPSAPTAFVVKGS